MTRMMHLGGAILCLTLGALGSGCNSSSKDHARGSTVAATTSASTTPTTSTATPSTTGATAPPTSPPPSSSPTTGVGSPFWYQGDQFGNPLKVHTATEDALAQRVLVLVNQQRALVGAPALQYDAEAERAAKAHVEDEAGRGYFSHLSPEGWTPEDRLNMTGATGWVFAGENLAVGQRTASDVVAAWMASPGHRMNMLDARYTHLGVGVDEDSSNWAQVFLMR